MDDDGPAADDLTDEQVSAIQAASDAARVQYEEIVARDPSVAAAMQGKFLDERRACLAMVRDAYLAAGVSEQRAAQAADSWLIARRGVRGDLELGDELIEERLDRNPRRGSGDPERERGEG